MASGTKHMVAIEAPDGLGAGWSNPLKIYKIGRSGEIIEIKVRGDVSDATSGTADLMIFTDEGPPEADLTNGKTAALADLDPDSIPDERIFVEITGLTITAHATDKSDSVNLRATTSGAAAFARRTNKDHLWLAIKGVTGVVHVGITSESDV